jgi:hypothetical protein
MYIFRNQFLVSINSFFSYHNVIKLVPIFSYKNRYIVTPKIQELYTNLTLQKELVFFVVRNGRNLFFSDHYLIFI